MHVCTYAPTPTLCLAVSLMLHAQARADVVFDGSGLPEDQGWFVGASTLDPPYPFFSADGHYDMRTIDAPSGGEPLHLWAKEVGISIERGFSIELRMRVIETPGHNPLDAPIAFITNYDSLLGDRRQTVYFDEDEIGFGDESGSFAVDTTARFRDYRIEAAPTGCAQVFVDGVLALEHDGLLTNGTIAFGDATNDGGVDGHFRVEHITVTPTVSPGTVYVAAGAIRTGDPERSCLDEVVRRSPNGAGPLVLDRPLDRVFFAWRRNPIGIYRVNVDGTGFEIVVATGQRPVGIATDIRSREVYWTEGRQVWRANMDGTFPEMLHEGEETLFAIDIDRERGFLYWTSSNDERGSIHRASLDGTDVVDLVTMDGARPGDLVVDPEACRLYWTDGLLDAMFVANCDGSGVKTLVEDGGLLGLDLDLLNGFIYWTNQGAGLFRARLDGSGTEHLDAFKGHASYLVIDPHRTFACSADSNDDCAIDMDDIIAVLAAWGPCDACPADLDNDGRVDLVDLLRVLTQWSSGA